MCWLLICWDRNILFLFHDILTKSFIVLSVSNLSFQYHCPFSSIVNIDSAGLLWIKTNMYGHFLKRFIFLLKKSSWKRLLMCAVPCHFTFLLCIEVGDLNFRALSWQQEKADTTHKADIKASGRALTLHGSRAPFLFSGKNFFGQPASAYSALSALAKHRRRQPNHKAPDFSNKWRRLKSWLCYFHSLRNLKMF